jgi:nucleotide-binding universal stress UspA family protein
VGGDFIVRVRVETKYSERASFKADPEPAHRSILVALGGRAAQLEAITLGRRIAETIHATLHGLFVWPWNISPRDVPRLLEIDPEALRGMVLDVAVGDAAECIAEHAQAGSVAFLVLPVDSDGPDPCGLGVAAARALRQSCARVIIVRPGQPLRRIQRILVPLDGTPSTAAAIAPAGDLARLAGASLDLVMVGNLDLPTPVPVELGTMATPQYVDQPQHEWPAFSQEFLARFLSAIGRCPQGVPSRFFLRAGDPAREILRAATDLDSDLIALVWHGGCEGDHGRVFRRVLHDAGLPVLVLRG